MTPDRATPALLLPLLVSRLLIAVNLGLWGFATVSDVSDFLLQVLDNSPPQQVGPTGLQCVREGDGFAKAPKLAALDKGNNPL